MPVYLRLKWPNLFFIQIGLFVFNFSSWIGLLKHSFQFLSRFYVFAQIMPHLETVLLQKWNHTAAPLKLRIIIYWWEFYNRRSMAELVVDGQKCCHKIIKMFPVSTCGGTVSICSGVVSICVSGASARCTLGLL